MPELWGYDEFDMVVYVGKDGEGRPCCSLESDEVNSFSELYFALFMGEVCL